MNTFIAGVAFHRGGGGGVLIVHRYNEAEGCWNVHTMYNAVQWTLRWEKHRPLLPKILYWENTIYWNIGITFSQISKKTGLFATFQVQLFQLQLKRQSWGVLIEPVVFFRLWEREICLNYNGVNWGIGIWTNLLLHCHCIFFLIYFIFNFHIF